MTSPVVAHKKDVRIFSDTEEDTDTDSVVSSLADLGLSQDRCLFCNMANGDFDTNIKHMNLVHGFFLPDIEYLEDPTGLIIYLAEKVDDCICIYCNGRGKEYKSQDAVRKHMVRFDFQMLYIKKKKNPQLLTYNCISLTKVIVKWLMMNQKTQKIY